MKRETIISELNETNNHYRAKKGAIPTHCQLAKKLLAMYEEVYGEPLTKTQLYKATSSLTLPEIELLTEKSKNWKADFFKLQLGISNKDLSDKVDKSIRKCPKIETIINTFMYDENECEPFSEKLENFLGFLCYIKKKNVIKTTKSRKLPSPVLHVHGNKNWMREKDYAPIFEQHPNNINSCVELFGGSGILTADASVLDYNCIYNDDDKNKQNFFKCLIDRPADLRMECIYLIKNPDAQIATKSSQLHKAALFWINSNPKRSLKNSLNQTWQFEQASEIYKNVKFIKRNAIVLAKEYADKENFLVIVDPPYPFTRDYSNRDTTNKKTFDSNDWEKLAKIFNTAKCICTIHCRLTAPKDYSKSREEQDLEADTYICRKIEQLFIDKGFYYKEIPYGGLGTIECMISNYPFESFSPFTTENRYENSYLDNDIPETPNTCSETTSQETPANVTSTVNTDGSSALKMDYIKEQNLMTSFLKQLKRKFANIVQKLRK